MEITDAGATWIVDLSGLSGGGGGFKLGQFYQGGYIFYIDSTGSHGLIAAPGPLPGTFNWHGGATGTVAGAQSQFDGAANTAAIVAHVILGGGSNSAAQDADNYAGNGFTDWYLPSIIELHQLYVGMPAYAMAGIYVDFGLTFWSSSENPFTIGLQAWEQQFNGYKASQAKTSSTRSVWPIRAF